MKRSRKQALKWEWNKTDEGQSWSDVENALVEERREDEDEIKKGE
jgi:hypothetical protein